VTGRASGIESLRGILCALTVVCVAAASQAICPTVTGEIGRVTVTRQGLKIQK